MAEAEVGLRLTLKDRVQVAKGLRDTADELEGVAKSSDKVAASSKKSGGIMSKLGRGTLGALKKGAIGATAAVAGLGATALWKGFNRLTSIENATAKLEGLGHSGKTVDRIMDNALTSVKGTAFGLDEAATTAAGAVAAGVKPGKDLERTLSLVGDAATIAGTDMGSMGSIFNKVAASDMIQGDVLAQLGDAGIPILQLLSKELGVSATEVRKLASQGKIDFATFQDAMEDGLGGAAQESGKTFSGAMKNMQASLGRIGAGVLGGIFPQLSGNISSVTDLMTKLEPKAAKLGEVIGDKLGTAVERVTDWVKDFTAEWRAGEGAGGAASDAFDVLSTALEGAWDVGQKLVDVGGQIVDWANENRDVVTILAGALLAYKATVLITTAVTKAITLATAAWTAAQTLLNGALALNPIGLVVAAVAALAIGFYLLYQRSETFRNLVNGLWNNVLKPFGKFLGRILLGYVKTLAKGWLMMGRFGVMAFRFLINAAFKTFDGILSAAEKGLGWIPKFGPKIRKARGAFDEFGDATIEKLRKVENKLKNAQTAVDNLARPRSTTIDITTRYKTIGTVDRPGANPTPRAAGGPVTAGRPYIVGERRPELFVPNVSGTILPRVPDMTPRLDRDVLPPAPEPDLTPLGRGGGRREVARVINLNLDGDKVLKVMLDKYDDLVALA